jgi:hypothetical protein
MQQFVQFRHEAAEGGLGAGGNVLEIDAEAGEVAIGHVAYDFLLGPGPRRRIPEPMGKLCPFPLLAAPVVDQRHDAQAGTMGADVVGYLLLPIRVVLAQGTGF